MNNLQVVLEFDPNKSELIVASNIFEDETYHLWMGAPSMNEKKVLNYVDEYCSKLYGKYQEYLASKEETKEEA